MLHAQWEQKPFAWYDPSADKFTRDLDDPNMNRGAVLWRLYRDAQPSQEITVEPIDFTSQYRADARAAIKAGGWSEAIRKCLPVAECFMGSDGEVINPSPLSTLTEGYGKIAPLFATTQEAVAHPSQARCQYCDDTGDVHTPAGEWRGECTQCNAAAEHAFKNFHAQLCARFNYEHDPIDWKRDQVSLIEHIAKLTTAQPSQAMEPDMFWNHDDAEKLYDSVDEFLNDEICNGTPLEVGDIRTIQCAIRLPNFDIRVTAVDDEECEAEYEVIAAINAKGAA